jgi:hypothetical protein
MLDINTVDGSTQLAHNTLPSPGRNEIEQNLERLDHHQWLHRHEQADFENQRLHENWVESQTASRRGYGAS